LTIIEPFAAAEREHGLGGALATPLSMRTPWRSTGFTEEGSRAAA